MEKRIARALGARRALREGRIQEVWSGYGELVRFLIEGGVQEQVVAKVVRPGQGSGRSHQRKLRSYEVELHFYQSYAARCDQGARIARLLHGEKLSEGWLFLFEDLDALGFPRRTMMPRWDDLEACIQWLARFHATFLGQAPEGLWKKGTYWHLSTRPDEHRAMPDGPLKRAAARIDQVLSEARFKTLVHGDAKPENFCFPARRGRVAAVDFQYVGGGVGVKDLVYLLTGEEEGVFHAAVERYFELLRVAKPKEVDGEALEREWRELIPWAWADFQRFLGGWAPRWRVRKHESAMTDDVLSQISPKGGAEKPRKTKSKKKGRRGRR